MINYNPMNSLRILLIFIRKHIFYILRGERVKRDTAMDKLPPPAKKRIEKLSHHYLRF